MLIVTVGAVALSGKLDGYGPTRIPYLRYGIPTAVVLLVAIFLFRLINRPKTADFLIATESEMKKVSWSTRKEIVGSTKVVIVFTFILAAILASADLMFVALFSWLNVMG